MSDAPEVHGIMADLLPLKVAMADISPDPANVKDHPEAQLEQLVGSLRAFGQTQPLVVDKVRRIILAGNGRHEAMRRLKWTHCAVVFAEWSETQGATYQIADNRIPEGGKWNTDALSKLLPTLKADDAALSAMLKGLDTELTGMLSDAAQAAPAAKASRKVPQPVIKTELVFDSDSQQQAWFAMLRKLRDKYPALPTHGARIAEFARECGFTA